MRPTDVKRTTADPSILVAGPTAEKATGDEPGAAAPAGRHTTGTRLERALPAIVLACLFDLGAAAHHYLVGQLATVAFLLVVPGALLLAAADVRPRHGLVRLAYAVAGSVLVVMVAALAASALGPLVGVARPLARWPFVGVTDVVVIGLLVPATRRGDPIELLTGTTRLRWRPMLAGAGLFVLPIGAAAGADLLNNGHSGSFAVVVSALCGAVLVATAAWSRRLPPWFVHLALYCCAGAVVLAYSMRSGQLYGFDIQQEYQAFSSTMHQALWRIPSASDPYRSMLSITALPTVLAQVSGVSGLMLFKVVYPLVFAFTPVLLYALAARWAPRGAAAVAAALLIAQPAFGQEMAAVARQEVALVFFGVLVHVAFSATVVRRTRQVAVVAAATGMTLSHYTTSYVTVAALLATFVLFGAVRLLHRDRRMVATFSLPVLIGVVGVVAIWNAGITHSTSDVTQFASKAGQNLPFDVSGVGAVVHRIVAGSALPPVSAHQYYELTAHELATEHWIDRYPAQVADRYPAQPAAAATVAARVPGAARASSAAYAVAWDLMWLLAVLGILALAWREFGFRWKDRRAAARQRLGVGLAPASTLDVQRAEFAALGIAFVVFLAVMRFSRGAAIAYNPPRAEVQAAMVVSVGLAGVLGWLFARRRLAAVVAGGAIAVMFFSASGLSAMVGGGSAPANFVNAGESYDRFYLTSQDVAAARWLADHRNPRLAVYTDRYGVLPIWEATQIDAGVVTDGLVPATIDRHAYVFLTSPNIADGTARGAVGDEVVVYRTPLAFLRATKRLIYSDGSVQIYQ